MTDKAQARILFFAAHWGQKYSHKTVTGNVFGVGNGPMQMMDMADHEEEYSVQVVLKPLSEMTEEDLEVMILKTRAQWCEGNKFINSDQADFLRSRGYLIDFMGYDPIAEGWAVLTTEE